MENITSLSSLIERDDIPTDAKTVIKSAIEQQKAEHEIAHRYKTLFDEIPIGLYRTTPEGEILDTNPHMVEMLGYDSLDELKKFDLEKEENHFHPSYPRSEFKQLMEKFGTVKGLEASWQKKDGSFIYVRENAKAIRDESGKVLYYEGSVEDISDKKEAEEELRQSEKRFRELVETSPDAIALADLKGKIMMVNNRSIQQLGYKEQELIGMNALELFTPENKKLAMEKMAETIKLGRLRNIELNMRRKDGSSVPVEMNTTLTYDDKGKPDGFMATIRNIIERKKAEKARKELEEKRDNFIWITSHELRTPITVLAGYIEILKRQYENLDPDNIAKIFTTMEKNIGRLEKLTMNVTTVSRIVHGDLEVKKQTTNLLEFLEEVVEPYHHLLGEQFEFIAPESPSITIEIDKNRIQQVIDNVLNNAIKNTHPEQRRIKFSIKDLRSNIEMIVSDNGAGIDSSNLTKIFDQFVSIETEYSITGTGIGLFLSLEIINAHGGTITAQSDGVGQGSQFIISLPKISVY
ncbi:MAG: PAS domain S-box protein [Candidatus Hodarchaeota archaeon]